jgi:hypothetical protein
METICERQNMKQALRRVRWADWGRIFTFDKVNGK